MNERQSELSYIESSQGLPRKTWIGRSRQWWHVLAREEHEDENFASVQTTAPSYRILEFQKPWRFAIVMGYGIFSKISSVIFSIISEWVIFALLLVFRQFYCLLCFSTTVMRLNRKFSFLLENPWPRLRNCFFLFFACISQRICIASRA